MRPAVWRRRELRRGAACWRDPAARGTAIENRGARDLTGAYWCSIEEGGHAYPRFRA